jgi:TPR repeat protein
VKCLSEISCRQFLADPANSAYVKALYGDVEEPHSNVWEREPDLCRLYDAFHALKEDPVRGIAELRALAEIDSQMSMLYLGHAYGEGVGVPVDLRQAATWFRHARDKGSPFALRRLGGVLEQMEDFHGAHDAYSTGVTTGDRLSIYYLGRMYMLAPKRHRDPEKARTFLSQATSSGNLLASRDLAYLLIRGHFGVMNRIRGAWMLLALLPKGVARLASVPDALTNRELDVVRQQVQTCWDRAGPEKVAQDIFFEVVIAMNRDGTVREARVANPERLSDPSLRSVTEAALETILNPIRQPFRLPPKKYEHWRTIVLSFTQKAIPEAP